MKKFLFVASTALILSGCGDISNGDVEKAINTKMKGSESCFSLQDNNIRFIRSVPVRVNVGYESNEYSTSRAILAGLKKQGLLDVSVQNNGFSRTYVLEITDKGEKVNFWNTQKGVCVGHKAVDEVKNWTEPSDGNGQKMTRVSYTWKLADIPNWVDKTAFSDVRGMVESVDANAVLVKTKTGWQSN